MIPGLLSITARWGQGEDRVVIRAVDGATGSQLTEIHVDYEAFARALTGSINQSCTITHKARPPAQNTSDR